MVASDSSSAEAKAQWQIARTRPPIEAGGPERQLGCERTGADLGAWGIHIEVDVECRCVCVCVCIYTNVCNVMYCTVQYCTVLYCTVRYCTVR